MGPKYDRALALPHLFGLFTNRVGLPNLRSILGAQRRRAAWEGAAGISGIAGAGLFPHPATRAKLELLIGGT
jgi:hypothetical protein